MRESEARQALERELVELQALEEMSAEARAPVALDQTAQGRLSRMDALQAQAMALETQRRRQLRRRQIEAALKRIEVGTFGFCVACDEPIEEKRLALDPATPTCLDCAS